MRRLDIRRLKSSEHGFQLDETTDTVGLPNSLALVRHIHCEKRCDISFGIPLEKLHEILNGAELAEEFADDITRWDDNVSGTQQCIEMHERFSRTSKPAVPVLELANVEPFNYNVTSTFTDPIHNFEETQDARTLLPSKVSDICRKTFSRTDALFRHMKSHKMEKTHPCDL
ncbi:hypothetical protein NPIL_323191 [Nephila pilipes]|uniref:C2H2-type domain-containing protein n=1 Tax=Nephila pilipes TaxID=299642 RepID=A0A8X6PT93_NEPPI|nr:hypothetical protein NPIL_323191 [Nephila pilipes]